MSCLIRKSFCCQGYTRGVSQLFDLINGTRKIDIGLFLRHVSSTSSFSSTDSRDLELSFTTYPQEEDSLDSSKKPLVFLHGLFGAKGNLHSVAKHLADNGRKIVTFDARNHGDSEHSPEMNFQCMSEDLIDLIQELQLNQPIILGHSMGGRTAMYAALDKPESLSTLIVADVTPNHKWSTGGGDLKTYAEVMKAAHIPQDLGLSQARKSVQVQLAPTVPSRSVLSFLLTNLREFPDGSIKWRFNLDAIIDNFNKIASFPDFAGKSFSKPTLFIFGKNSHHYKMLDLGLLRQLFPQCQVEVIPGAGHFLHAEKPLEFVEIITKFLKSADLDKS